MTIELETVLKWLLLPIFLLLFVIYESFFVWYLHEWFVVPLTNTPLTMPHIAGLLILGMFFKRKINTDKSKVDWNKLGLWLIAPWILLLIAYVIRFYIM